MARTLSIVLGLLLLGALLPPGAAAAPRKPLIAPPAACPGLDDADASTEQQLQAMRCMTNVARQRARLDSLTRSPSLSSSSRRKARDILRCDSVSHFACGRSFTYWMRRSGYLGSCWRVAENIARGTRGGTARSIFQAWLHSPEHRRNILGPYDDVGIGLETGRLHGREGVRVWIQHFGSRCGS
ncbi:MAG TPA: CAP domain-containing protein [Solirubrobacterales bacterium]|nr:CAP domain-containing protein [Solirubrobacterales bacterium]